MLCAELVYSFLEIESCRIAVEQLPALIIAVLSFGKCCFHVSFATTAL